uniref:[phosphatase 2A protein]-leucine-carboxy methyltransferase n=2 Tax=Hyaloperonospora arabidopsidis (strain Emoy2) TaxID=559515 RepID=M4C3X1_HYAAE
MTLGYFQDPFLRFFVDKPTRRIPLIHRGYYLRHVALDRCVELFLSQYSTAPQVNIVSLGAGFDTLFFRLLQKQRFAGNIAFTEVDCDAIATTKSKLLKDPDVFAGLLKDTTNLSVVAPRADEKVAWRCQMQSASYSIIACDLGDLEKLDAMLDAAGVERSMPTLILAECVVSYLAPEKGTELLRYLGKAFFTCSIALYDPIGLHTIDISERVTSASTKLERGSSAFSSTLQRYFAAKGCTLRGARGYQTAAEHCRRLLARGHWKNCRILDMNGVFAACTTVEEKRRLALLEPFDEYADWMLCNAHYAIYLADNCNNQDENSFGWITQLVSHTQQYRYLLMGGVVLQKNQEKSSEVVIIRSFQLCDLAAVRSLFKSTHLDFGKESRAVRQFVANRLSGPSGDMFDVHRAFLKPNDSGVLTSGFWVAEVNGEIVGCVGLKPQALSPSQQVDFEQGSCSAELCRLGVAPTLRRRGVASALVRAVEAFAVSCGAYSNICLETIGAMEGAQQLYRVLGYVEQADKEKQHSSFKLVCFQKTL